MALVDPSSFIDTSGNLGTTLSSIASGVVSDTVDQAASDLECQIESAAFTITNAAESIVDNAINTAGIVAGNLVASAVGSAVGAVVNTAESVAAGAVSSVTGMLEASAAQIANNVASSVGNLFSNTLASIGTTIRLPIPDPVAAAFGSGVPQSTLFATNSILSQMESVTLGTLGSITSAAAGFLSLLNLPAMLVRYGVQTAADLENAIASELAQLGLSASYSPLASFLPNSGFASPAATATMYGCACGPANYAGYGDYATLAGPIASSLTGSADGLAAFYNPYLSDARDSSGNPITGIPDTVSARTVTQITSTLTNTLGVPGITVAPVPYAAQQSLFDGLYAISAKLGLVAILEQMASSPVLFGSTTQAQARTLLATTTSNPTLIVALLSAAGAQSVSPPPNWAKTLVANTALTAADVTALLTILSQLNIAPTNVYTTADPTTLNNGAPVNHGGTTVQAGGGSGATTGPTTIFGSTPISGDGGSVLGVSSNIWTTGWDSTDVDTNVSPGNGGGDNTPIILWDQSVLIKAPKPVTSGLLATSTATAEGAASHSQPTTGLPSSATLTIMARGIPRSLTSNGNYIPLSQLAKPVTFGNLMSAL